MATSTETLPVTPLDMARDAVTFARVTGSVGGTQRVIRDDVEEFVTVERIRVFGSHASVWRVTDSSLDGIVGSVLVTQGTEGQFVSHGWAV